MRASQYPKDNPLCLCSEPSAILFINISMFPRTVPIHSWNTASIS